MRVAHPHEAVALDAVPEVLLAAEVRGARGGVEDGVEARVARLERARHLPRTHQRHGAHELELEPPRGDEVDPHEAEARVADLALAHVRHVDHAVADRVVVPGPALAEVRHRLRHGLAEADARLHVARAGGGHAELEAAVQLAAEVEQHGRLVAAVLQDAAAGLAPASFGNLTVLLAEQRLGVRHLRAGVVLVGVGRGVGGPHHAHGVDERAYARIDAVGRGTPAGGRRGGEDKATDSHFASSLMSSSNVPRRQATPFALQSSSNLMQKAAACVGSAGSCPGGGSAPHV